MLKKIKPKTFLIIMAILLALQLLTYLRMGLFNVILNSAYFGFSIITLISLKKKELKRFGGIYLLVVLAINAIVLLFNYIESIIFDPSLIVDLVILITKIFCLYNITIKNDYKFNKLFKTMVLSNMLFLVGVLYHGFFNKYAIIEILVLFFIEEYFYNYERNYIGLYDQQIYEKEKSKVDIKPTTAFDFIKTWILYILIFEAVMIFDVGFYVRSNEIMWCAVVGLIIMIAITIAYSIVNQKSKDKIAKQIEREKVENEKIISEQTYSRNSKEIYNYYKKNNYDINEEETNKIIAGTRNISVEELITMYHYGYETILKEKEEKLAIKLKESRQTEEEIISKAKQESSIFGKDKYLSILNERIEGLDAMQKLSNIMSDSYVSGARQATNTRKSDPYILGGMAQGIAGPAAGLMIASQVERENLERELRGKEIAAASMESAKEWRMKAHEYSSPLYYLKKVRDRVKETLIINEIEQAKEKIKITSCDYRILDTKNFSVSIEIESEKANILNKDAIVDGSFKVKILDEENNIVAEGYQNAKNIQINSQNEVNTVFGFDDYNYFCVYCIPFDYSKIDENKKYKVEVEFINLWIMEVI